MFLGNYCWRFEHGVCIGDLKLGRKLFAAEHFCFCGHDSIMTQFCNCRAVNFDQIGE
jgi:hypothetical protein